MKETLNELHKRHGDKAMALAKRAKYRMDRIQAEALNRLLAMRDEHADDVRAWWAQFEKEEAVQLAAEDGISPIDFAKWSNGNAGPWEGVKPS